MRGSLQIERGVDALPRHHPAHLVSLASNFTLFEEHLAGDGGVIGARATYLGRL
jgi:hypothetical protein